MKKQSYIFIVLSGSILMCLSQLPGSSAFGLSLLGPPRSILKEGQSAISLEYNYSNMDLEAFGLQTQDELPDYTKYKIEKLKSSTISGRLDTCVYENWDLFVRIGTTDGKGELKEEHSSAVGHEFTGFDGNFGFSWGVGTRATFYKDNNISWGGTFQVNWAKPGKSDITDDTDTNFSGTAEIKYWEFQIGIGPTLEYDNVRIYGGPFLHFIKGDLDISGKTVDTVAPFLPISVEASQDIREKSQVGGFLGAQWNLGNNNTLITEGQLTADGWNIGVSATWKF
jgi:hypothetical protein